MTGQSRTVTLPRPGSFRDTVRTAKTPVLVGPTETWWLTRTPNGPGSLQLCRTDESRALATAWGPGAAWLLEQAPALVGRLDDIESFASFVPLLPPPLARLWRTRPFRLARTDRVWDAALGAVLGQRVQTTKAARSRRLLARRWGQVAPGPRPSWILPGPEVVAELGYHDFHQLGVERTRAATLIRAAREIARSERAGHDSEATVRRLAAVRGIGPWTLGLVRATALGDADAVLLGDFHLPNTVAWNLVGEARADDERMLELLEPFRGHRWRVAMLTKSASKAPSYGPRLSLTADGLSLAH